MQQEYNSYVKEGQLSGTAVGAVITLITGIGVAVLVLIFVGALGGQTYELVEDDIDSIANNVISGETFTADNLTSAQLNHGFLQTNTLTLNNGSATGNAVGTGNFTINADAGTLLLNSGNPSTLYNGSTMYANYTWGAVDVRHSIKAGIISSFDALEKTGDYLPIIVLAVVIALVLTLVLGMSFIGGRGSKGTAL